MDKLIYSVREIFAEFLQQHGCEYFNIPEYQRGYKWTADNIIQLLEDLKNFKESTSDEFYCLQNITITKVTNKNDISCHFYNVIDGQQRLTTLFILLSYLERNVVEKTIAPGTLKYSIRFTTDDFLQTNIYNGNYWNQKCDSTNIDTKDKYYIAEVAKTIEEWFKDNCINDNVIYDKLKLIVNEVDNKEEETIFACLNGGKVDLDGADLVRAILITRAAKQKYQSIENNSSSQEKINQYRVKLGIELDNMNQWWADKDVKTYFEQILPNKIAKNKAFVFSEYPIDLLYHAFYEAYKEYFVKDEKEKDLDLRFFEKGIDINGKVNDDYLEFYNTLKEFHLTLVDWYNDDEIYNLVGYLLYNFKSSIVSFKKVWNVWDKNSSTKSNFKEEIKKLIRTQLANAFDSSEETEEEKFKRMRREILDINKDWYNNNFTYKLLPLIDILPFKSKRGNVEMSVIKRINTAYLKRHENEDKEHVRSQKRDINEENLSEEEILSEENEHGLNSIGNIVLLHETINRSYGNSQHTLKMERILNEHKLVDKEIYIRPHTFEVFMSKISNFNNNGKIENEIFWSDNDIEKTMEDIDRRLSDYLHLPQN